MASAMNLPPVYMEGNCQLLTWVSTTRETKKTYDWGIFLLRALDNGVDPALVEECNRIPTLIISPYPCSMSISIAQKED